ncbi:hypothetical protein SLNSH_03040 [Alsobacter soli]|uniref:Uncharacterized protein n=1 Tax=Alsobacter soli TaxID=2109933 RepID=A0A2T1HXG0_9HYPH|nr:hypothetical protein [Alsobacter soli]PSC06280.1 hypothetical protein SLNSH_03040 [Alsobacter soli]
MALLSLRRAQPSPVTRLSEDLDRIIDLIQTNTPPERRPRMETLTTAVAALNALMCKGATHRFSGIQYDELRVAVADYLERSAFGVLVERLSGLPITLSLVTAAAKDCQLSSEGQEAAAAELRQRAEAIIHRLNRCVLA